MSTKVKTASLLALLPAVNGGHIMALANEVTSGLKEDKGGDFILSPTDSRKLIPSLIMKGVERPMLNKTLSFHLSDKDGGGIAGLVKLANDGRRKVFKTTGERDAYKAIVDASPETDDLNRPANEWFNA